MLRNTYDGQVCSIARSLELIGERWTLLIVRELLLGPRRFTDLLDALPGIGRNLLAARLRALEEAGVLERIVHATRPPLVEYRLTERGKRLKAVVDAMRRWAAV